MNKYLIICIILAVRLFGYDFFVAWRRKNILNKLADLLMKGQIQEFEAMTERKDVQRRVPPFNLDYLKLNRAMISGDKKKTVEMFDSFKDKRLNEAQKKEIATRGFNYFITEKDKKRAAYYKDQINTLSDTVENKAIKEEVNNFYDICIEKKTGKLKELLRKNEELDEQYRSVNEFLISTIYETLGDKEKQEEYRALSRQHMEMLDKAIADRMSKEK
ncbi:MAG: hypothetical protein IJG49_00380 [Erysipelotrichaceae bacterium]|nr:hypothetical protein [Erysipelotrichaceae bacterium]